MRHAPKPAKIELSLSAEEVRLLDRLVGRLGVGACAALRLALRALASANGLVDEAKP